MPVDFSPRVMLAGFEHTKSSIPHLGTAIMQAWPSALFLCECLSLPERQGCSLQRSRRVISRAQPRLHSCAQLVRWMRHSVPCQSGLRHQMQRA